MDFLKALIVVSEKAANIARIIRQNEHLFSLLVEKKTKDESNPRFVEDFKTLADVLIQEMVKHDIKKQFPEIRDRIFGEENNKFKNKLGETIEVEIKENKEESSKLLLAVLDGDTAAAELLAEEVHKEVDINEVNTEIPTEDFDIDIKKLGIWIDPIDGTTEYINGEEKGCVNGIYLSGLKCVTVLIGVFNQETGLPVIGVLNHPFASKNDKRYHCIWGVCVETKSFYCPCEQSTNDKWNKIICVSSSEDEETKEKLRNGGYELVEASGAGYKILTTILGLSDAYVLSKETTFFWDTCSPQAILRAMGGDIVIYEEAIKNNKVSIEYAFSKERCNIGGIVAYKCVDLLEDILKILSY